MKSIRSFTGNTSFGTLFLVPTPIGNLDDMTFRAVNTLQAVDLIASEDTRNTQKLLNHFDVATKQISFHEHNTQERIPQLVERLKQGENIAQVSDAGMPSISDPGHELVVACIEADIAVVPLPGANAALTALIASGIAPQPFYFYGFLDRKPKRQVEELEQLKNRPETLIFYEAPHRLKLTLKSLVKVFGETRQATLCRELTKKFEEFLHGSLAELLAWTDEDQVRGEFVVIVSGNPLPTDEVEADPALALPLNDQIQALIDSGLKTNAAIKTVARERQLNRQEVYNVFHNITVEGDESNDEQ